MEKISSNAIQCTQNGKSFIITVMKSSDLKQMCFVSRKKEDAEKGFQRLLSEKRAKEIASYLDNGEGVIPSALIFSAQTTAKLTYSEIKHEVTLSKHPESLLVLDGQHRLYGLFQAKCEYEVPVIIFNSLNSQEEIRQFIDINTKQKGVPTALILDIKSQAGTENKTEERQRLLFDSLNSDSILAGYLLPNESKTGKISRTTFNQATKQIFENGPISDKSDDVVYKAIKNFLYAIDSIFKSSESKEARIQKNILFKAVFAVFNEVCDKCLTKYGNFKEETIKLYLEPLSDLDYSKYTGTNKTTEAKIISDIKSSLREAMDLEEDVF